MATFITYNGVTIHGCTTRAFLQRPFYDQTDTDLLYYKFRVRVQGYVHGLGTQIGSVHTLPPAGVTGTFVGGAADAQVKIRFRLEEPRHDFNYVIDGVSMLQCREFHGSRSIISNQDLNNGPKPRVLDITHIVGANIFRIEWEIEICMLGCDDGDSVPNASGVLSNRWSLTDDMDKQFMRTRTYTGRLRAVSAKINPISFVNYVLPVLQRGFKRERVQYVVSASGLEMDYTITDREVHVTAPKPATEFDIRHAEIAGDALLATGECYVRLAGDRYADHGQMIQLAVQIVDIKLHIVGKIGDPNRALLVENFAVTDIDGTNGSEVQVRARVQHGHADKIKAAGGAENAPVPNPAGQIGKILTDLADYDPTIAVDLSNAPPLPLAAAFSCALQNPCDGKHRFHENVVSIDLEAPAGEESLVEIEGYQSDGALTDDSDDYRSEAQKENPYTFYQADNRYQGNSGTVQLPIAVSNNPSSSGGDPLAPTSAFVQLHAPMTRRTLTVKAQRVGAWPVLPAPESYTDGNGIEHRSLEFDLMPGTRERSAGGDILYRSEAYYVWGLSRVPTPSESLRIGRVPWDSTAEADETMSNREFQGSEVG
jgi:hypothetical protein